MSEAVEGEVLPPNTPTPVPPEPLDPEAIELGNPSRAGRPTDMTPEVVTKLIAAFNNAYNITEACEYAGIARVTYYRWLEKDDQFSYKMSKAQSAPTRKAKEVVVDAINKGDANLGFRWLERRDPDFKPKAEVYNTPELAETREKIKDFLDDTTDYTDDDAGSQPTTADSTEARGEVADAPTDIS